MVKLQKSRMGASNYYITPYSMVEDLLKYETFEGTILEPCASKHRSISTVFKKKYEVIDNVYEETKVSIMDLKGHYDNIITNIPYGKINTLTFFKKMKTLTNRIICLLPLTFLIGKDRHKEIFGDKSFPLKKIYQYTRYSQLTDYIREDGKYHTGMMSYCWFVFEKNYEGPITLQQIDNSKYCLGIND
jgi:hypothetical protein